MKNLYVIDDRRPFWTEIALLLEEVNAQVRILTLQETMRSLQSLEPNMLILGEESHRMLAVPTRNLLQLVVSEKVPAGRILRPRSSRNIVRLGWPAEKEFFFELTRRMLTVPDRWPFKVPVLIDPKSTGQPARGESEDFSLTGIAFRSSQALENNAEISISFGDAGSEGGLNLDAEIVRASSEAGKESTLYGARFLRLSPSLRHALERFVWTIKRRAS